MGGDGEICKASFENAQTNSPPNPLRIPPTERLKPMTTFVRVAPSKKR